MFASRGTWCSCFAAGFSCYSWWLPPPRRLGAARIVEWRWWLSLAPILVIVRRSWPFPGGEPKGTLVDCSWLVWSSSCVGCTAPYWGFGMWCQLAHEPSSEWITTTRSSLSASKWTSIKKIIVFIIWFRGDWSSLILILVIDWFTPWHGGITILLSLLLQYRKLVVKLFSVASCESLLVWLVWLFS